MEASGVPVLGVGQIPIDYILHKSLIGHGLTVHDAQGNVVFRIGPSSSSARRTKILFDSVGNPLVTVLYLNDEWRCFRGNSQELEDLIFTVHKILYSPSNTELDVLLSSANSLDQKTGFRLKGNPFRRACTIIQGDSIVAQVILCFSSPPLLLDFECFWNIITVFQLAIRFFLKKKKWRDMYGHQNVGFEDLLNLFPVVELKTSFVVTMVFG
ncbi:hypothetical protein ZIOFF_003399 [Zingiber officinale]|uniref:Uncharacterized protein n=1 Tax=Zingiber officinale TaxID=94328 RepID=A0A8J5ID95_ZINOF|nr:hypothetical protein ZIOFF_003399 [Zingiber officinale]